jgi:hypothetical protein
LNVAELKVFILGGVMHEGEPRPIDIQPLRAAMRIQKMAREIKLEHVAKGWFIIKNLTHSIGRLWTSSTQFYPSSAIPYWCNTMRC